MSHFHIDYSTPFRRLDVRLMTRRCHCAAAKMRQINAFSALRCAMGRACFSVIAAVTFSLIALVGCSGQDSDSQNPPQTVAVSVSSQDSEVSENALADETDAMVPIISRTSVTGRVMPAISGLVFTEYDETGVVLQESTPTDDDGVFVFPSGLRGIRVEGRSETPSYRVPTVRSARVVSGTLPLQITALTTWFEQLVATGETGVIARESLNSHIAYACGQGSVATVRTGYLGNGLTQGLAINPVLAATHAYFNALRDIGLDPSVISDLWLNKSVQHLALLRRMCAVATTLYSNEWLAAAKSSITTRLGFPDHINIRCLGTLRNSVTEQVLALLGEILPGMEYEQLADTMNVVSEGQESALALEMIHAMYSRQGCNTTDLNSEVRVVLNQHGVLQQAMSGRIMQGLTIANRGMQDRLVRLAVNGEPMGDISDIIADILVTPVHREGESLQERAWRYVVERTRHKVPFTAAIFINQPDLYLRSLGSGFCDDVAGALHWIWRELGYDARVRGLSGHVVPEVMVNGRWEMYDPDLDVYYFNFNGRVASVDELGQSPTLITSPLTPTSPRSSFAYSQYVADIYSTTSDNVVNFAFSSPFPQSFSSEFLIPLGGYLKLTSEPSQIIPSLIDGYDMDLVPIQVWFPPGYSGNVAVSMVIADLAGDGIVTVLDRNFALSPAGLATVFLNYYRTGAPNVGITNLHLDWVGPSGVLMTLLANPRYFNVSNRDFAEIFAEDLSGLMMINDR